MESAKKKYLYSKLSSSGYFDRLCDALSIPDVPNWPDYFGESLFKDMARRIKKPIRTLSLFSGAGGLDIGFHDAGFQIEKMVEKSIDCIESLKANSGESKYFSECEILPTDILDYHPPKGMKVDFIVGGPPCQTFSAAGRRVAGVLGSKDSRGQLFKEYVRLVKLLKPKGFLFENVSGLSGVKNGHLLNIIQDAFASAGYVISSQVLDAADYGVPQHRERLFIVGMRGKTFQFPRPTHGPDSHGKFNKPRLALRGVRVTALERKMRINGKYGHLLEDIPPGLNYSFFTEKMGHPMPLFAWRSKFSDFLYKAEPNSPIRTLKADGGQYTGPFHWKSRPFGVNELKRLQTFPDNYELIGSKRSVTRQIGNSVPPQLSRILALCVIEQLFGISPPISMPVLEENETLKFKRRKHLRQRVNFEKAKAGILKIKETSTKKIRGRSYKAVLSNSYELVSPMSFCSNDKMNVFFRRPNEGWVFEVNKDSQNASAAFTIEISHEQKKDWSIEREKIILRGNSFDPEVFTSTWKAFESELIRWNLKADLVQLCGYYNYSPHFTCKMRFHKRRPNTENWEVVRKIVEGLGTRQILTSSQLAKKLGIRKTSVMSHTLYLRKLGYEVRNHNTNPRIPEGSFLVPYAFPTLNASSMQLKLKLE